VIDVQGDESGRVKEDASNRTVPVHPFLIEAGFLAHVEKIKVAGGGHLWSELRRSEIEKKYGDDFAKWFQPYRVKHGLDAPGLDFHSFRKNVASALHGAGVNESVVADILGHEHKSMSYRLYSEGAQVAPLYNAICKLDYGVDLSHLILRR
jgi:integrase